MRSHPSEWVIEFFNRKLEELLANPPRDGFGLIHVLEAMDNEQFFPCNPMQVVTLGYMMKERMKTVPLQKPAETKDSMVGPYLHYWIQEGYEPPPLEEPGSPAETEEKAQEAKQGLRDKLDEIGAPPEIKDMFNL